jgi:hypothetical protein
MTFMNYKECTVASCVLSAHPNLGLITELYQERVFLRMKAGFWSLPIELLTYSYGRDPTSLKKMDAMAP